MSVKRPLADKVALITGANQGLGLMIARKYAEAGASLMICARDKTMLQAARAQLEGLTAPGRSVAAGPADISRREDVSALVSETIRRFGRLDILVNNAGIYGPKGPIDEVDWDEWMHAVQINLFGSILMCRAVLPHLRKAIRGKIVQLSGGGATNPLPRLSSYAVSKAGIIRFVETLAEEVREHGIDVNAIAPGALNTRMLAEILEAGPEKVGRAFYERSLKQKESGGTPLDRAAELAVFLGSSASDGITGKLISAVWDPWETLARHVDELKASDVYTLRRIIPKDRGMAWGSSS